MEWKKGERELCIELKRILKDEDAYIGTMLMLSSDEKKTEGRVQELLSYIRKNPEANYETVMAKADEIAGL